MRYCARCVYPENARPTITFDEEGVCSGCRAFEAKESIDWNERKKMFEEIIDFYKSKSRENHSPYDCIIPVSGGKDSHFQVYMIKEVYGLNPLLVTYNHIFNTAIGIKNLTNLVERFNCDLLRLTVNPASVKKIARYMLRKVGDMTWHYHAGIMTFPFQIAVKYRIPLIIWGEHGYTEVTGMFRLEDIPEFTKWVRKEHEMRGLDVEEILGDESSGLTLQDLAPYQFPSDEEIEEVGVRGIYLGNYFRWDAKEQAEFLVKEYGFKTMLRKRDRTPSLYHKIDDHANEVHDYLKYLKFGYGRATDIASLEIRNGRMTREEGIELVKKYDHVRPRSLDIYLKFLDLTEEEFERAIEHLRDRRIWEKEADGKWYTTDHVSNHIDDPNVDKVRVPQKEDRTFSDWNWYLYYNEKFAEKYGSTEDRWDDREKFIIL